MDETLTVRRELLRGRVLAHLGEPIREPPELEASLPELIRSVKAHGLEGLVVTPLCRQGPSTRKLRSFAVSFGSVAA